MASLLVVRLAVLGQAPAERIIGVVDLHALVFVVGEAAEQISDFF